ncbi:unnamed protein product [Mycena citricolor]|uniref:Ribose-5-phosphate isomerase n=1 Tax=Mycena citricolor TaxID=2018698 RepID=A0AAD2HDZ9_9AGAR|nr:unnamed protein product [Mycena citricolor]CAK5274206.1 unnamed protein product [Mycena citricolor]
MRRSLTALLTLRSAKTTMPLPSTTSVASATQVRPIVRGRTGQPTVLVSPITEKNLPVLERSKQLAAWTAVDEHVKSEHRVIGIGSGSTVPYVVERIVQLGAEANQERVFIPTGFQSKELIVSSGLNLGDVDQYPTIDVTLDGADECVFCHCGAGFVLSYQSGPQPELHQRRRRMSPARKSARRSGDDVRSGCFISFLRCSLACSFILVADHRKNVEHLGTNFTPGIPIEVVPFAYAKVLHNLHHDLKCPKATLRMAVKKAGPVVSDNGNFVIDAPFDQETMKTPYTIMAQIKMLTGVVEVGVFCNMAKAAYFGNADGTVTVKWNDGRIEQVAAKQ